MVNVPSVVRDCRDTLTTTTAIEPLCSANRVVNGNTLYGQKKWYSSAISTWDTIRSSEKVKFVETK